MEPIVVGVDVGGTKVLAGVVAADGSVVRSARRETPGRRVDVRTVEDALSDAVREAAGGAPLAAVGVATAGLVDAVAGRVLFCPHLPWLDTPVRERFEQRWAVPVAVENDATAAALAEARYGAARGADDVLVVNLGTGIGGGLLLGGRLHRGWHGLAGEFGHTQVVPEGLQCECGLRGCWEQYASGNALVRFVRDALGSLPSQLDEDCGGNPAQLTGPMITAAAQGGDQLALRAFAYVGEWLGVGLANLVAAYDPERVVVGGGVSEAHDLLLAPARAALAAAVVGASHRRLPEVVAAELGNQAGLVGAAELARQLLR